MFKTSILSLFVMTVSSISSYALTVDHLRVQSLRNPNGIDVLSPQFSWQLHSDERNVVQTAYQLMIFNDANDAQPIYDSGMVESSESAHVTIKNLPLQPATRYHWQVTV